MLKIKTLIKLLMQKVNKERGLFQFKENAKKRKKILMLRKARILKHPIEKDNDSFEKTLEKKVSINKEQSKIEKTQKEQKEWILKILKQ